MTIWTKLAAQQRVMSQHRWNPARLAESVLELRDVLRVFLHASHVPEDVRQRAELLLENPADELPEQGT